MAATIKIKNSSTASAVPTSSDLVQGELAVNVTDKRLFTENASGTVVELGTNPTILTLPDGSASAPTLTNDGDTNTGIFFPAADTVGISTGGSERARVDSSGNLGLGVTPSSWSTLGGAALEITQQGNGLSANPNALYYSANAYFASNSWRYAKTGYATQYYANSNAGSHVWNIAASGTAGNAITFTQAMTLDASGNLGVGVTNPSAYSSKFVVGTSAGGTSATFTDTTNYTFAIKSGGSGVSLIGGEAGNALAFQSGASERARIDSSGNLSVGRTSGGGRVNIQANSNNFMNEFFNQSGSSVGSIQTNGTTTSYVTSSDYRLKHDIQPMTGALAKVALLKPVTYKWNSDNSESQGFIAHELQAVVPDAVVGEKDAVDADGNPQYQGIDTSFLVATLTAAIQELKAEFDAYKASHP